MILSAALAAVLAFSPYDDRAFELPEDTVASLQEGLEGYLRDAPATRFRGIRGPRVGEFTGGYDVPTRRGTILCVQINGKNAYGAYIGYQDYVLVIADDGHIYPFERMDRYNQNTFLVDAECRLPADEPLPAAGDAPADPAL